MNDTNLRIMIVEDDFIIGTSIKSMITSIGHTVVAIEETGETALPRALDLRPDLLLIDIMLKGRMDGITLAEEISRHMDVPVIYITGYSDKDTLVKAKATHPYNFLLKPVNIDSLKTAIDIGYAKFSYDRKIRESEKRYTGIVENLPLMLCRFNPETSQITYINGQCARFLGADPESLIGKNFFDLLPGALRERSAGTFGQMGHERQIDVFEHCFSEPEGDRWLRIICQALFDNSRLFEMQFIALDVSDVKNLEKELLNAGERERRAIGQELHDSLGQLLTGISFLVKKVQLISAKAGEQKIKEIDELNDLVIKAARHCRALSKGILPLDIDSKQFNTHLAELVMNITTLYDTQCILINNDPLVPKDNYTATHLFHIIKEAMINSIKHGGAGSIHVSTKKTPGSSAVIIEDNGKGMTKGAAAPGLGMNIMRYRAGLINARITFENVTPAGFRVSVEMGD